jgi:anaerobic magnesium-protoporphyrin IX monomethyl ester cyclase
MKIHFVSLEDGITAIGFRKMAAFIERLHVNTRVFYAGTPRYRSLWKSVTRATGGTRPLSASELDQIAEEVARGADLVAFSSMTGYAELTKAVAARVRRLNPKAFLMWGGIHPIVQPEDAITADVDAICVGEGEFAFAEWLDHFESGRDFGTVQNFWFKRGSDVRRNRCRPLMTPTELETLPFPKYGGPEWIYRPGAGFTPATRSDYLANNGLAYPAIWSIGCPLECTFCGNTVFIANDESYRRIRHPTADYVIREVLAARQMHPHLATILFYDDSFMALRLPDLIHFAVEWRERVRLPFCVYGVIPTYVQRDKVEVLTWAGMNRVRMGIQSGSERMLKFYRRPTPLRRVEQAAATLSEFARFQVNPAYDVIVDNPVETREDVVDTLELIYRLPRPFTLNIFSLRVIPNTTLQMQMQQEGINLDLIDQNYRVVRSTWANSLLYVLMLWRPPCWLFDRWLRRARPYGQQQRPHAILIQLVRSLWLLQQGLRHARFGEFSEIGGYAPYLLWKAGVVSLLRRLRPKLECPATAIPPSGSDVARAAG